MAACARLLRNYQANYNDHHNPKIFIGDRQPNLVGVPRAMLDHAIAALNANRAKALSEFNNTKNTQFHDRDLYISCYNMADGKFTAFTSRAMIGADIREMKLESDSVGQRAYDAIKGSAEGSIATMKYNFPKPGADKPASKESIAVRVGNQVCGMSYYK
jgi:hypothetical protein